jgi:hypothetical protein
VENVDKLLAPAVSAALSTVGATEADTVAIKLAHTYASMIDEARQAERWANSVLAKVDNDSDLWEEVKALKVKLSAKVTLSDLGPKLAAILAEMGATPKARALMSKATPAGARQGTLAGLRAVVGGQ